MNLQETTPDHIISRTQFRELTGISRSTEWRLAQENQLPALVEINGRALGYLSSSYTQWLQQNLTA
jgi:predicted DNA-binding transcriptional regulator AlpA